MVTVIPDFTLFVQASIFILLIFLLNFLLYKPILSIIERRKKQLEEAENEIKLFQDSVNKKVSEYDEKLNKAKTTASDLKKEIINEGAQQAKSIVDAVRSEIPLMTQEFQKKIDAEMQVARQVLEGQSRKLSMEIAEKVLGRRLQ
ncbi:MAG TPA: ATP synthase F0 subunit B [Smithellaceae bacterium]|nr:ATP synthase F0 subunit B [Smithellaceae bacterium]HQF84593.1 ATP synthase F0 subunit B [Smithellaceae bacterium]HQG79932.1 ATP synthase F0 subunit B [Smithellaceae bacterium]